MGTSSQATGGLTLGRLDAHSLCGNISRQGRGQVWLGCMHVRDWAACMYAIGLHVGATGVRVRVFGVARCVVEGEVKELFPSRRFDAKGDMERMGRVVGERLVD